MDAAVPAEPAPGAVTLTPASTAPVADAVVTVAESLVGATWAFLISYRIDDAGARRHLHLAWHHILQNDEEIAKDALWVTPSLDEFALADVRLRAALIAERQADGRVPYAFQKGAARFAETGVLELNGSLGLTCATFVELVFASASITLLDAPSRSRTRSRKGRASSR